MPHDMMNTLPRIIERQKRREADRRILTGLAGQMLSQAKRAIFKLQRQDHAGAKEDLHACSELLKQGSVLCKKDSGLLHEGSWRAAQEELCEAHLVYGVLVNGKLSLSALPTDDPEILIGGLADLTGELARYAVIRATEGDRDSVDFLYDISQSILRTLLDMDLTGSLRSKFDQAKQHVRKLEETRYQLSLRVCKHLS